MKLSPILAVAAVVLGASPALAGQASSATSIAALQKRVLDLRLQVARAKSYDELENISSTRAFYVDKGLWSQVSDLFAYDSSMELAQRGVYGGPGRVREFLMTQFGPRNGAPEGPGINRLADHAQYQTVIHVAPDNKTAKIRSRAIQVMGGAGQNASWGAGVYENEMVNEGGVWKYKVDHVYNTFTMPYEGGLQKAGGGLPGINQNFKPDRPPSLTFKSFPFVYDIPIHYKNPVTGR